VIIDEVEAGRLREADYRGSCRAVDHDKRFFTATRLERHVYDLTTAAPGDNVRRDGLHHKERSVDVDVENAIVIGFGDFDDWGGCEKCGVVD